MRESGSILQGVGEEQGKHENLRFRLSENCYEVFYLKSFLF